MRTTVLGQLGNHSQLSSADAGSIIKSVARELTEDFNWSTRRREAIISIVAPYTAGSVAVTNGSATVTGSSTVWTSAMQRRGITIAGLLTWLRVGTVASATSLSLVDAQGSTVAWPGSTGSGKTYSIFGGEYDLGTDVSVVLAGVEGFRLTERTRAYFDALDPQRLARASVPNHYALTRTMLDGGTTERTFIEFWPVPSTATVIRVPYLCVAPELSTDDHLPACPSQLIELLSTSRCADFIFTKTGDARWSVLSDRYWKRYDVVLERLKGEDEARGGGPMSLLEGQGGYGLDLIATRDLEAE